MASRFLGNLSTPGVSIFRLPSATDPIRLPYLDFHNTATATDDDDDDDDDDKNMFIFKI